jgi:hypothetical protein
MFRFSAFIGAAILGMAFLVGSGASQDAKKETKAKTSYVPAGWKVLGLSKDQTAEFAKIHNSYKGKIKDLEDKILEAKTQEKQEMVKLLTEDQKDKLRKLVIPEDATKDAAKKDSAK